VRRALPYMVLATAWLILVRYAYPGLMTIDSVDQLREARAGFYTDPHPPAMSALWRLVEYVVTGPAGMLVLQTVAFVAGLYLIVRRALSPLHAAVAAALLCIFPPIMTPLAVIWKDCLMAGFLMVGIGLLLQEGRKLHLAGLVVLVVATAVRYNAPAATFAPIVLLFQWRPTTALRRYAIAASVWVAVTFVGLGSNALLTDKQMHFWHSTLAPMDIAGTWCHVDDPPTDDELRKLLGGSGLLVEHDILAAMCKAYEPRDYGGLIAGPTAIWTLPFSGSTPAPPDQRAALSRAFWTTVTSHPIAYLQHRAAVMRHILALRWEPANSTVMMHVLQPARALRELGIDPKGTARQGLYQRRMTWLATKTPLFRPWIYLLLALVALAAIIVWRTSVDALALLLSGLGTEASMFLLGGSADYRYSHWMVVCTCTALVMLISRRIVIHRARSADV
jgi:hypothetical protein